jgi:hypothetical protein
MDEMSVWLDDKTDLGEVFFLLAIVRPNVTDSREKRNHGQSNFLRQKIW